MVINVTQSINDVLLVDDELTIRMVAVAAISGLIDWNLVLVEDGTQATEIAATQRFDLIALDVMMPKMDGPTTLGKLREIEHLGEAPFIFMTAKEETHEVEKLSINSAVDVISKPFDPMTFPEDLLQKVNGIQHVRRL